MGGVLATERRNIFGQLLDSFVAKRAQGSIPAANKDQDLKSTKRARVLRGSHIVADDFVPFDNSGDPDALVTVILMLFGAQNLADCANEHFRAPGYFGGQRHGQIEFGAGIEFVINQEIDPAGGDISGFPVARRWLHFDGNAYDDWQRKIVAACRATFCHLPPNSRPYVRTGSYAQPAIYGAIALPNEFSHLQGLLFCRRSSPPLPSLRIAAMLPIPKFIALRPLRSGVPFRAAAETLGLLIAPAADALFRTAGMRKRSR